MTNYGIYDIMKIIVWIYSYSVWNEIKPDIRYYKDGWTIMRFWDFVV